MSTAKDASSSSQSTRKDDDFPPGTQLYTVYATDRFNDSQIVETQVWFEGITKDKARIQDLKIFPDLPDDVIQRVYDSGKWEDPEGIDSYQKVLGQSDALLDDAGADIVRAKKEWIRDTEPNSMWRVVSMSTDRA
jgi:hypothetical protein